MDEPRQRRIRKDIDPVEVSAPESVSLLADATAKAEEQKPLKPARSQAELVRVRQGWFLIGINCLNLAVGLTILLVQLF